MQIKNSLNSNASYYSKILDALRVHNCLSLGLKYLTKQVLSTLL